MKLEKFSNINRYRDTSVGVQFFASMPGWVDTYQITIKCVIRLNDLRGCYLPRQKAIGAARSSLSGHNGWMVAIETTLHDMR